MANVYSRAQTPDPINMYAGRALGPQTATILGEFAGSTKRKMAQNTNGLQRCCKVPEREGRE